MLHPWLFWTVSQRINQFSTPVTLRVRRTPVYLGVLKSFILGSAILCLLSLLALPASAQVSGLPPVGPAERGIATHTPLSAKGAATASGAKHNPAQLTAAHATFPMGTRLEVKRTDNGAKTQVLVEDRMRPHAGRIINLSHAAAKQLDMIDIGTVDVQVRKITEPFTDKLNGTAAVVASRFHGRKTASGEVYDETKHTAAHRTLPFGTEVKVYVRSTQQKTIVRINDRTAKSSKSIINLSAAAARELGMPLNGTAIVLLEVRQPSPRKVVQMRF